MYQSVPGYPSFPNNQAPIHRELSCHPPTACFSIQQLGETPSSTSRGGKQTYQRYVGSCHRDELRNWHHLLTPPLSFIPHRSLICRVFCHSAFHQVLLLTLMLLVTGPNRCMVFLGSIVNTGINRCCSPLNGRFVDPPLHARHNAKLAFLPCMPTFPPQLARIAVT